MKNLRESLLDIDFDIEDDSVQMWSVSDGLINLIQQARKYEPIDNIEEEFKKIEEALMDVSEVQRGDRTSIMKKLRMKDNTAVWAYKVPRTDNAYKIIMRRFIENPRPWELTLNIYKLSDGTGRIELRGPYKTNHLSNINPQVAKCIAFFNKSLWDDVIAAVRG